MLFGGDRPSTRPDVGGILGDSRLPPKDIDESIVGKRWEPDAASGLDVLGAMKRSLMGPG